MWQEASKYLQAFSGISSQIAVVPCFIWKQLVYLWSSYSPEFWCVYSMYGNTQRMGRLDHCVCLKQSLRDSRSVCARFHSNALCQSAFTQLLNNTCMIRGKSHQCIKYIKYFTLDGDGNTACIEKNMMTYFLQSSQLLFFLFKYSVTSFSLRKSPSSVLLKLIVHREH